MLPTPLLPTTLLPTSTLLLPPSNCHLLPALLPTPLLSPKRRLWRWLLSSDPGRNGQIFLTWNGVALTNKKIVDFFFKIRNVFQKFSKIRLL